MVGVFLQVYIGKTQSPEAWMDGRRIARSIGMIVGRKGLLFLNGSEKSNVFPLEY